MSLSLTRSHKKAKVDINFLNKTSVLRTFLAFCLSWDFSRKSEYSCFDRFMDSLYSATSEVLNLTISKKSSHRSAVYQSHFKVSSFTEFGAHQIFETFGNSGSLEYVNQWTIKDYREKIRLVRVI